MGKRWLYYILDEMGRSYFVQNGIVQISSTPVPLEYTPDGWQKVLIGWERNWTYFGINRNYTNPLSYVKDGAQIMRSIFYNGNIESKAYLLIQEKIVSLSSTEYSFVYEYFYKGENDFSTFKQVDINDGYKVTLSIMEGGFSKFLKAYAQQTNEIQCNKNEPTAIKVRMDGVAFDNTMNFTISNFLIDEVFWAFTIPLAFINEEGDSFYIYKANQSLIQVDENNIITWAQTNTAYFFTAVQPVTLKTVKGSVSYINRAGFNNTGNVMFVTSLGNVYNILTNVITPVGATTTIDFNFTIPLAANENLFLIYNGFQLSVIDGNINKVKSKIEFFDTDFSISTNTRLQETICYARRPKDVFQTLTDDMCGIGYTANSTVLDANKNYVITSGKAIRGFDDAFIKTTFDDFYKTHSILHMAGLEYDDTNKTVEIEKINKYFDASNPIFLGRVKKVKIGILTDQMFNLLNIGYKDQNYDTVNGLREFNTTEQYSTVITRVAKILDMVMPYRADCYGIEILRKDYQNLDTTDSSSDDDVFLLDIEDTPDEDGIYNLRRPAYSNISGVILDGLGKYSVYNTRLSPKNLLLTNGPLLHSLLYGFDQTNLTFQTSDKNNALSTTLNGVTITEAADQMIGSLAAMLFKPITFESQPEPYPGLIDLLNANTNRCFSFEYNGNIYKGFNLKVGVAPNDNAPQTFQLLSSADNDLTKLIEG